MIGTSLATPVATSLAGASLTYVNRSILRVALALGALLFFRLTSPIRQLTAAARATSASARSHVRGMSVGGYWRMQSDGRQPGRNVYSDLVLTEIKIDITIVSPRGFVFCASITC